ncbi:VWA domain-containing protein, partial [Rhodopirellula sp. MGV]|uniref:VWA domain-containing protein n=1 Tax=Rhodopirellula sp. MGV TaxID=2023130 RepID=UPI0013043745
MAIAVVAMMAPNVSADEAQVRIVSFTASEGDSYFAASIMPSADDTLLAATSKAAADVVIIVDTSASQAGDFRRESMAALKSVLSNLRSGDRAKVYAADVDAVAMTSNFASSNESNVSNAMGALSRRLPLGHTNMVAVIEAVRGTLLSEPQSHTRSIVYIGDGASIDATGNETRFSAMVDALRADHISVHSIAIGPTKNVELMAILANQTGGVLGIVEQSSGNTAEAIARQVTDSAVRSPIWVSTLAVPSSLHLVQAKRLPPLRVDRDSILLGTIDAPSSDIAFSIHGDTPNAKVTIEGASAVEADHPDFSFLPGLVATAANNNGLTLPTANSGFLRQTAELLANQSSELVRAGKLALKQGNKKGAKAIADMAVQADSSNEEAKSLQRLSGTTLIIQNDSPFGSDDDPFGGDDPFGVGDVSDAADEAPAGDAAMDDLFGGDADAPPAAAADDDVFGNPDPAPAAPAPAVAPPAPAPAAPAPSAARMPELPPNRTIVGDDEILESGGDLLRSVESQRAAVEGRLRAEVRASLRLAERALRSDPTGVAGQLKSVLARVQSLPDINPKLRRELESQLQSAIQAASVSEARFAAQQENIIAQQEAARATAQMLEKTFRREATLQTLSRQMNALIDEGQYDKADGEVSLAFADLAGDSITEDSVAGRHFTDQPLALQVYDRDRRYKEMRERNFVDAFSLVLKSNIPFVDEPPVMYPDADVWRELSDRRLAEYGSIQLVGDNETEQMIEKRLSDDTTHQFIETPLNDAIRQLSDAHDIPIVIDRRALDEIGADEEMPVSIDMKNVSLRSFLRLMLRDLDLTYLIKDEVMQITTVEAAEENLVTKVYPVGDLVVPIVNLG